MTHRFIRVLPAYLVLIWHFFGSTPSAVAQTDSGSGAASGVTVHILQQGETIESLSALFRIPVARILQANGLAESIDLQVGTRLIIPLGLTTANYDADNIEFGLGDSLDVVARSRGLSLHELALANRIVNPMSVYVGQQIAIPESVQLRPRTWIVVRLSEEQSLITMALDLGISLPELALVNEVADPMTLAPSSLVITPGNSTTKAVPAGFILARIHPVPLEQGRSAGILITGTKNPVVTGSFNNYPIHFVTSSDSVGGVFGVDRWTKPGLFPIHVQVRDSNGAILDIDRNILVISGHYQSEDIRLSDEEASLLNNPLLVAQENAYIASKMKGFTPNYNWATLFQMPTAGVLTSTFGTTRLYNAANGVNIYHSGNDLAAQIGTPVYAPADGVVVDTGELAVRGLITILDHGGGVYSGFWHQSRILVNPGDVVAGGQQIGMVGNTGLSTASHLHWEMWVDGVPVDSMQWLREKFP